MFGAIRTVAIDDATLKAAEDRINSALGMFMGKWNDKPKRTAAEVIAKLRAVAFSS